MSLMLLLLAGAATAQDASAEELLFSRSLAAYEEGNFAEAEVGFRALVDRGHHDGPVLYNLGNAAYRSGRFAEAVYAFEWARRLQPGDQRIAANLALARAELITDEVSSDLAPAARRLLEWLRVVPLVVLAGLFLAAWTLGWLLLGWRVMKGSRGATGPGFGLLLLAALLALPLTVRTAQVTGPAEGVLLAPEVVVRSGPGESYAALFELHAGTVLQELEGRSGWLRVRVPHGPGGWVPDGSLAVFGRPETLGTPRR
jgi:hypothetical protein